ncbi:MAG: hypothetical protein JWO62_1613 [Acidimicrobiaceae bacterium]|nr:hypothetical protein [Acidimicrobiaceae bacterium]
MITAGIDLSSQSAGTAACTVDWSAYPAKVAGLTLGVHDDDIVELIRTADKVGIDVPLGWPIAFVEAVTQHSHDGSWPPTYRHADTLAVRLRRTDLRVRRLLKISPLSVSSDRIALPAMRAAALLSRLPDRVPRDGSGVVVEVYPAAALCRWGLPFRGYKRKENADARRELIELFAAESATWLRVGEAAVDMCLSSDDAFDAEDRAAAAREGWIAVPTEGTLGFLIAP